MRTFTPGIMIVALAVVLLAVALVWRSDRRADGGDLYRRGFLGGEQILLMPGNRYDVRGWSCFGATDTASEFGTWTQLGDIVSLVPSTPGRRARVLKMSAAGRTRTLYEPAPGGGPPDQDAIYERVD